MSASLVTRVIDLAVQIQQIPAPTFEERERVEFIRQKFTEEELCDISIDATGNAFARLPGAGDAPSVVVTAHCDTVFPKSTELTIVREPKKVFGPGIGDNSLGVAGLFGLLWWLRAAEPEKAGNIKENQFGNSGPRYRPELPGDLWLVANVGEEGLGDLCGMRAVVDRFGNAPLAYIVLEGMALGQVYHRGLAVRRYRISARTAGGHSWVDYGRPSAIHQLAAFVTQLSSLDLPDQPRTTVNVGLISGGTSVNTIASRAYLELDLRSEDSYRLEALANQVEAMVQSFSNREVKFDCEITGQRPVGKISARHPLVRLAQHSLTRLGIPPNLNIGSTDANIPLSQGIPAVCVGLTTGGGAHTTKEYIDVPPLEKGLQHLVWVVSKAFHELLRGAG
jgi:tripeptide aminopeptidase